MLDTPDAWRIFGVTMVSKPVRFGVKLEPETDLEFRRVARVERRSKSNMHEVIVHRVMRLWRDNPELCKQIHLIVPVTEGK